MSEQTPLDHYCKRHQHVITSTFHAAKAEGHTFGPAPPHKLAFDTTQCCTWRNGRPSFTTLQARKSPRTSEISRGGRNTRLAGVQCRVQMPSCRCRPVYSNYASLESCNQCPSKVQTRHPSASAERHTREGYSRHKKHIPARRTRSGRLVSPSRGRPQQVLSCRSFLSGPSHSTEASLWSSGETECPKLATMPGGEK